jgi:hypothetical protein
MVNRDIREVEQMKISKAEHVIPMASIHKHG